MDPIDWFITFFEHLSLVYGNFPQMAVEQREVGRWKRCEQPIADFIHLRSPAKVVQSRRGAQTVGHPTDPPEGSCNATADISKGSTQEPESGSWTKLNFSESRQSGFWRSPRTVPIRKFRVKLMEMAHEYIELMNAANLTRPDKASPQDRLRLRAGAGKDEAAG
jgi:hypothetical protein